jgi:hypothetical protein
MKKKKGNMVSKTYQLFNFLVNFAFSLGVIWIIIWLIKQIVNLLYLI